MKTSRLSADDSRRSEPRIPIDLGSVPFLGSRESGLPSFTYFLRDVSLSGVGLMVPPQEGMVALEVGEMVNFHLPFQLNQKFYNQGAIRWEQPSPRGQMCGAQLQKRVPLRYPIYVAFESNDIRFVLEEFGIPSIDELAERILEDAYYLKRGVSIYFEHLVPIFARHSLARKKERLPTEEYVVPRIRKQIEDNVSLLADFKSKAAERSDARSFPTKEDLESIRKAVALEINLRVLSTAFDVQIVLPYLRSVRLLEHQLYSNFNTLVLLHLQRGVDAAAA
jgi:PilZ domain